MKGKMAGAVASLFLLCVMDVSAATGSIKMDVSSEEAGQIICVKVAAMKQGEFCLEGVYQNTDVDLNGIENAGELETAAKSLMELAKEEKKDAIVLNQNAMFTNLEEGVYLIYSDKANMMPTLIFIPMWDESEMSMQYDVEVQPKFAAQEQSPKTGWECRTGMYLAIAAASGGVILWLCKQRIAKCC